MYVEVGLAEESGGKTEDFKTGRITNFVEARLRSEVQSGLVLENYGAGI